MAALLDNLTANPPPLAVDAGGVIRVGGTRVRLDSVLYLFNEGRAPEDIQQSFPSLNLTDIYAVITYYLWHREEVDAYLEESRRKEDELQREVEARCPPDGIRERLLARRARAS